MKAVLVKWRDSCGLRGWNPANHRDHRVSGVESIGWLVREDAKSITITTSLDENNAVMDALTIPRESIVKMKRLPFKTAGIT